MVNRSRSWSSMVPHVQHAGRCGNLRDHCWNMLEFAGPCWTMLDHLRGTRGMIGRSRMTDRCTIQKRGLLFGNWGATPTITASSSRWLMDLCVECSASACVRMSPSMKILPVALHGDVSNYGVTVTVASLRRPSTSLHRQMRFDLAPRTLITKNLDSAYQQPPIARQHPSILHRRPTAKPKAHFLQQ